jgi:site-specific recombinase XerC
MRPSGGWSVGSRSAEANAGLPVPSLDAAAARARALVGGACRRTEQAWRTPVMASPVSPARSSVGSCTRCHGWGRPDGDGVCAACAAWLPRGRRDGRCRRCRNSSRLNRDALCRPCILEIRSADLEWAIADLERRTHDLEPRGHQLALLLDGVRFAAGQPSRRRDQRPRRVRLDQRPAWLRDRLPGAGAADDPDLCPPQVPGQLVLLRLPRAFLLEDAKRIRDRPIADLPAVERAITEVAGELGRSAYWRWVAVGMARLALAARDPDERLVREEALDQLPAQLSRRDLAEALRRAGLLRPRPGLGQAPVRLAPRPPAARQRRLPRPASSLRSCEHCLAWAGDGKRLCGCCREWAANHAVGTCRRCRRDLPLKQDRCRFCHLVLAQHALAGRHPNGHHGGHGDQLWFGGSAALQLWTSQPGAYDHKQGWRATRQRRAAQAREAARPVSPALVDPGQLVLFEAPRRDWCLIDRTALPALTGPAQQLLDEFDRFARAQSWTPAIRTFHLRSLRLLVAWLGAAAPIHEVDVKAVATLGPDYAGQRIAQFLRAKGLLIPDPLTAIDADQADVQWLLATLPGHLVPEVQAWIQVLRGEGRRPSPVMGWALIRRYLAIAAPVLRQWGERADVDSLRSITIDDVQAAFKSRTGSGAHRMQTALRSLFRALKRERLIVRDPAHGITVTRASKLPQPLPSDRLRGLLDRAPTTLGKLAVALVAIHALRPVELRRLHLADLDRARGRLTVRRPLVGGDRLVILDELSLRLAGAWLRERVQRWPHSTNPHLLVSQQTAVDPSQPPVCRFTIQALFFPLGITPGQLRVDRILDEARHTADPVHLMRLFGIADTTAMKYVYTAHPERRTVAPR